MIPAIGIGPLGPSEWTIGGVGGIGTDPTLNINSAAAPTGTNGVSGVNGVNSAAGVTGGGTPGVTDATGGGSSGSFGSALANAIGSLDSTQQSAAVASQQLATGQLKDPTTAITAVENASLAMDFAAQMRNQLDTAATTLFQTQV